MAADTSCVGGFWLKDLNAETPHAQCLDGYLHDGRRRERSGTQAFSIQDKEERMSDVCAKTKSPSG
jgi:hypothetical protein